MANDLNFFGATQVEAGNSGVRFSRDYEMNQRDEARACRKLEQLQYPQAEEIKV